jgi:2-iminobutanoate/2-iminopropanoate deaminase
MTRPQVKAFAMTAGHARVDRFGQRGIRERMMFRLALVIAVATASTIGSASAQKPPPAPINPPAAANSPAKPNSPAPLKTLAPPGAIKPTGTWNLGTRAGDFIYIAGMRGTDPKTDTLVEGDEARVRQAFLNMKLIAESEGVSLRDAVRLVVYTTDMFRFRPLVNKVQSELWGQGPYPPRTIVEVFRLNQDDIVEVEGTFYAKRQLTAQAQTLYREFLQWQAQQKSGRESKSQAQAKPQPPSKPQP